ncbi:phage holin family protein [Virgibacillus alimentarius]|uniref:Membrane protein n=1 Tax=Virgibacillus alimentarius TaxID=698769 RepID=A0ABS4S6Y0_9BACI|nr:MULTISPECIES: phage holin family protein [Virgibacillus]MBP2256816.1 putative membrane protein [Virgibacillus alimentarius]HLR65685.1 phage holin family protein [Virgibacillus sp.]
MLIRWLLSILLNSIALIAVAQLFDSFHLESFGTAVLASFILSILNVLVKPILVIFTLPITFLTLGLFLFVINAITLMITQGLMDESFVIDGFGTAIIAAFVISMLNMLLNSLARETIK